MSATPGPEPVHATTAPSGGCGIRSSIGATQTDREGRNETRNEKRETRNGEAAGPRGHGGFGIVVEAGRSGRLRRRQGRAASRARSLMRGAVFTLATIVTARTATTTPSDTSTGIL